MSDPLAEAGREKLARINKELRAAQERLRKAQVVYDKLVEEKKRLEKAIEGAENAGEG